MFFCMNWVVFAGIILTKKALVLGVYPWYIGSVTFRRNKMDNTNSALASDDDAFEEDDESVTEVEMGQVMLRPDGYHWQSPDGMQEFGPFETLDLALADMQAVDEETSEPGETLQEAEDEIGIADWIDPDTGEPAEGQSTPRLHYE